MTKIARCELIIQINSSEQYSFCRPTRQNFFRLQPFAKLNGISGDDTEKI